MKKKYIKPSVKSIEIDEAVLTDMSQPQPGDKTSGAKKRNTFIDDYDF